MRNKVYRVLSALFILIGIVLLLYPTVKDRYESYQQEKILKMWEDNLQRIEALTTEEEIPAPAPVPLGSSKKEPVQAVSEPLAVGPDMGGEEVEGILEIDKIDLKLPILSGATKENLSLSVASIEHTGKAGGAGNYAIAGHRNRTYGKNFNRLDEVDVGNEIVVDTGSVRFTYKVKEKLYVLPEDVSVLQGDGKKWEITLVTCHPMKNPTHRLIVKGELQIDKK